MTVNHLSLYVALALSATAAFFSIFGLVAIFPDSYAIIIMGIFLESAKLVCAAWLYNNWSTANIFLRTYLTAAVIILMLITSMGVFGYLSKSHIEQGAAAKDNTIFIQQLDKNIQVEKRKIEDAETVLKQLDGAVEALTSSKRIRGDDGAIAVRASQKEERQSLQKIIQEANTEISKYETEKSKLELEQLQIDLKVGPIKYVSEIFFSGSDDAQTERAVRWFIIILVLVFDPLAVLLLIAANNGLYYQNQNKPETVQPSSELVYSEQKDQPTSDIVHIEKAAIVDFKELSQEEFIPPSQEEEDMSLREKLIKNSTVEFTSTLSESKIYTKKDMITTSIPMINVALSGSVDGGMTPGITMLAGPSKHFKSGFALFLASSFIKKYPDGMILFYDAEFGTPESYFKSYNIPLTSVIHSPITDVEQLKHDIMQQLKEITRDEKVMIIIDSIGNLASRKEVEDALDGKTVADMSRAKQLKSLFRMVTPHLSLKDIPMVVINHTYKEMSMYPKDIVGGGTGSYYGSDNIWIIGRQQDKDAAGLQGYHFVINVEKSRYVKEKSKIPISISHEGGINKWSGLLDIALEGNYVAKPKAGWYATVNRETGEIEAPNMRAGDIVNNKDFWVKMFKTTDFASFIKNKYSLTSENLANFDELEEKKENGD